jgi:hypothetical protein
MSIPKLAAITAALGCVGTTPEVLAMLALFGFGLLGLAGMRVLRPQRL